MAWDRDPRAGARKVIPSLGTLGIRKKFFTSNWSAEVFVRVQPSTSMHDYAQQLYGVYKSYKHRSCTVAE